MIEPRNHRSNGPVAEPTSPRVSSRAATSRWLVLCGLLLLAFVPRCLMAFKLDVLCNDAVLYIDLAKHLAAGEWNAATHEVHVNTFPLILYGLNLFGIPHEIAGQSWNVLVSTLVVLPLFGWLRRMFDHRVAATACALYAVHPCLVEWSAEIIRGPTFWLLMTLSLYLSWRAVDETRLVFFLLAGIAIALAAATRVEGLLLFLPLIVWTVQRCRTPTSHRRRAIFGVLLCVSVPLAAFAGSAAFLWGGRGVDGVVRTVPIEVAMRWIESYVSDSATPIHVSTSVMSARLWQLFGTLVRGFNPVIGSLMLIGLVRWHRFSRRREFMPLWATSFSLLLGMWVLLWYTDTSSTRYVLPMVILGTPWSALGLFVIIRCVRDGIRAYTQYSRCRVSQVGFVLLALVTTYGVADALSSNLDTRRNQAAVGRWIHEQIGPGTKVLGPEYLARRVGYYAAAEYRTVGSTTPRQKLVRHLRNWRPDVILIPTVEAAAKPWSILVQLDPVQHQTPAQQLPNRGVHALMFLPESDPETRIRQPPRRMSISPQKGKPTRGL